MAYTGPVMSFYETITDNFKRMTDQEWGTLVENGKIPARPDWTHIYLAGIKGERMAKGAELPSQMFSGTAPGPDIQAGITAWPNPVQDVLTISFRTEKTTQGSVSLYHSNGMLVKEFPRKKFIPGSNLIQISFRGLSDGLYVLRLNLENQRIEGVKILKK